MKRLAIIAAAFATTAAFAAPGQVQINAPQIQGVAAIQSSISNESRGFMTKAQQNVSTNTAGVEINQPSIQLTIANDSDVSNSARGFMSTATAYSGNATRQRLSIAVIAHSISSSAGSLAVSPET